MNLGDWYHLVETPTSAKRRVIDLIDILDSMEDDVVFGAWNGHSDNSKAIGIHVIDGLSGSIPNFCILNFPYDPILLNDFLKPENLEELFRILIDIWSPEWGILQSRELRKVLGKG